jgi:hypothetical protein
LSLYEVVLRCPDREELRLTDRDPRLDGYVTIDGQKCEIVAEQESSDAEITRRFIVRPVSGRGEQGFRRSRPKNRGPDNG